MNAIQPDPQPHLWDGTPMAAMPYVISKGNDTPDQRVYEGMNMSKAEKLATALDQWDGVLMLPKGWRQQTSDELRRLSAINAELLSFVNEYVEAFENGMAGDSYLLRIARAAIAKAQGGE